MRLVVWFALVGVSSAFLDQLFEQLHAQLLVGLGVPFWGIVPIVHVWFPTARYLNTFSLTIVI